MFLRNELVVLPTAYSRSRPLLRARLSVIGLLVTCGVPRPSNGVRSWTSWVHGAQTIQPGGSVPLLGILLDGGHDKG
jgi:hypothetical protein